MANGLPAGNLLSFESLLQVSNSWLANLRCIEEHGADFFATGNEYIRDSLNLKFIPRVHADENEDKGGVILSDTNQSLRQSYLTAKHVFEHVERGTIKFVLIGLVPDCFCQCKFEDLSYFQQMLNHTTPSEKEDLNFDKIKRTLNRKFSLESIIDWEEDVLSPLTDAEEKNVQILEEYIELCRDNDAQPIGVVFPFAPVRRENYNKEILNKFREKIYQLEESNEFICIDMFDSNLGYDFFCDMTHLNTKGMMATNAFLSVKLYEKNLIPEESFCDMPYEYFHLLSYAALKENLPETTLKHLRQKHASCQNKARIDVKLMTETLDADFQILSLSDYKASLTKPDWFQKNGIGYIIHSTEGELNLIVKPTVNDKIHLILRGSDIRNPEDDSKRIPYWIDYVKLNINEQVIIDERTPTWHNKPYIYNIDAKANEEIKIYIEWLPHEENF